MIARFDKNGDGKLQLDEMPERMRAHLAEADTDKDGALSVDELRAFHKKRLEQGFARIDKNGDGSLSSDEVGERRWARLKDADANGDGKVTLAEMQEAISSGKLRPPMRRGGPPGGGPPGPPGGGPPGPPGGGPPGPPPGGGAAQADDGDDPFGD